MPTEDHFARLIRLLEKESEAEARQVVESVARLSPDEAEATGRSIVGLVVREGYPGLGGRWLLALSKRTGPLPWSRLGPGSPVVLSVQGGKRAEGTRGVVLERDPSFLRVAFDDPPDEEDAGTLFRVDLAPDEASRLRQRAALGRAASAKRDRMAELRSVLLGESKPVFHPIPNSDSLDGSLNASQREAVALALACKDVAVLHGPPGTGKTTAVVELVRRAVRAGERVLVCAPSNLGVDNVLERLLAHGERAVRLGHPARVLEHLRGAALDMLAEAHPETRAARKLAKEAFALFRQAGKWTRGKPEPGSRQQMRQEGRAMLADSRRMEARAVDSVLDSAAVLLSTLTGLDDQLLGDRRFGLVVIDEACQSTEPACWIALARAGRVVLAGDPCQLPPTVLSPQAAREGFGVSLLERLWRLHGDAITRRLDVQYRMNERIMAFPSAEFYDGTLVADESVKHHLLTDLAGVEGTALGDSSKREGEAPAEPTLPESVRSEADRIVLSMARQEPRPPVPHREQALTSVPVTFIDTAGAGYDEEKEPDGESRLNPQEAALAARKVRELLAAGVTGEQIAVIAPYGAQVRLLRRLLSDVSGLEVDSVDGFQGREKEAVVLSLVRSNPEGEIGFLADVRRTNVALTRARRCLVVVGDSATLANDPFYARMCEWFEEIGAYRTVWEE